MIIKLKDGTEKPIHLTRIHMEEDAGKSLHLAEESDTLVDFNRAGVALMEIVSEPEIKTSEEAYAYLTEIRKLVRYLDVCDGNMEEGSLRCDANVSVMLRGSKVFGTRAEVKNMNSIRNVQRAIDYEIDRQIELIESGGKVFSANAHVRCGHGPNLRDAYQGKHERLPILPRARPESDSGVGKRGCPALRPRCPTCQDNYT